MSNDITYSLTFRAAKRKTLLEVKRYLADKKDRWDNRGRKTAEALMKETGLKHAAEVVSWGFDFGRIEKDGGGYAVEVSSWANENSLGNIWISGEQGELHFLLRDFPDLEISGTYRGSYTRGSVHGSELYYYSQQEQDEEDAAEAEWGQHGDASYNEATKLFLLNLYRYGTTAASTKSLRQALRAGLDPNAWVNGARLVDMLFRHPEFRRTEIFNLLVKHGLALDHAGIWHYFTLTSGLPKLLKAFAQEHGLLRPSVAETRTSILRHFLERNARAGWEDRLSLDGDIFALAGPGASADPQIVELAVRDNSCHFAKASEALRDCKELALLAVRSHGCNLESVSDRLRDDADVVSAAVACQHYALPYASERLRDNRRIVLLAARGGTLEPASARLRTDRNIVLAACKVDGRNLEWASGELKSDRAIVIAAIHSEEGCGGSAALQFASKELRNDPELKELVRSWEGS